MDIADFHVSRTTAKRQAFFDRLLRELNRPDYLPSDPVQFLYFYSRAEDQEIAGFLSACFAYGKAELIQRAGEAVLRPMGENPAQFVRNFDGRSRWPGFYHRFHHEGHLLLLIEVLKQALEEFGSLGELFRSGLATGKGVGACERALDGGVMWLLDRAEKTRAEKAENFTSWPRMAEGIRFLFNRPSTGSACKRLLMYFRWMVRSDEVDVGRWDWLKPSDLIIPVDTHVGRLSYYLGLRTGTESRSPNWKMAVEITNALKELNPSDPVCYDFPLTRLGILEMCKKRYVESVCSLCPVESICRIAHPSI